MKSQTVVLVAVLLAITVPISYGHHHESHDQQEDHDPAAAAPAVPEEKLASRIQTSMESAEIVPDVVGRAPSQLITISYPSGVKVDLGNELTPTDVKDMPTVHFDADPKKFYTLVMTDPDAPSRIEPTYREFKHWIVVNIPGSDVANGEHIAEFVGSGPPMGTGLHRYVFLVYEQPKKSAFTGEPRTSDRSRENRPKFSVKQFAYRNNLGEPIAGNYYQSQFDDYVPLLHQQLSGN